MTTTVTSRPACADCGNPYNLRPIRPLTNPDARWLCADKAACVRRTVQRFYWTSRRCTAVGA